MLTHYVKVVIGKKSPIYLEQAKYVTSKGVTFLSGYQVKKDGDGVQEKGGDILHLIQLGDGGPKVYIQAMNPTYCELENADPVSGRWAPGVPAKKARLH